MKNYQKMYLDVQDLVFSIRDKKKPFTLKDIFDELDKKDLPHRAGPGYGVSDFLDNLVLCNFLEKISYSEYIYKDPKEEYS